LMARVNHWGLRLFKPVALDMRALGELVPADGAGETDFWLVEDPFTNLSRGRLIDRAQLSLLVKNAA
jgi:hypothetical protein